MKSRIPLIASLVTTVAASSFAQEEVAVYQDPNALFFAIRAEAVGDLSGDGIQELGVSSIANVPAGGETFEVLSGADGSVIGSLPVGSGHLIDRMVPAGDVDNDGVLDFMITDTGQVSRDVLVISGATFGILHSYFRSVDLFVFDFFGGEPAGGSDLNNDGHDDFYINDPFHDIGRFYSGVNGQVLHTISGPPPVQLLGDVNGDGNEDYATIQSGGVQWHSGADGSLLHSSSGIDAGDSLKSLAALSDRNADGVEEIVVTATEGPLVTRVYLLDGLTGASIGFANVPAEAALSSSLKVAGDMNGDGFEDFVLFGSDGTVDRDHIALYSGRDLDHLYLWEADSSIRFGEGTAALGDFNNDGTDDIAFSTREGNGSLSIRGGRELFLTAPDRVEVNEQVTLRTTGGEPGKITGLFLVEVNGSPLVFRPSPLVLLDAVGASQETIPMPFFPVDLTFLSFARDATNSVVVSGSEVVGVE